MLALDHIVISGNNAEQASRQYSSQLTIKAIKGGEHTKWGTYNYLSYFSNDSYLEWLGVSDIDKAKQCDNPLIKHLVYLNQCEQRKPFQFALRTNEMNQYIKHFDQAGIPFDGPILGEREKPDGTMLKWRMLFPKYDYTRDVALPFLIEWERPKNAYPDTSLLNTQTINTLQYSGMTRDEFAYMYQLKPKKLNKNTLTLQNCKIQFATEEGLNFEIV